MKILIAEDNLALQKMNKQLMNRLGYDFDIASNGKEAVEYAKKNEGNYDLCIMDIDMPIMNGIQATEIIRRKLKYFPVMAFSGNRMNMEKCLEIGMDDFLEKPCVLDKLFVKINELTVKVLKIYNEKNKISLRKEIPMNPEQLKELKELDKKGLALLIVEGGQQRFVVHKNIQNKMSHVLIGEGKELFEFLDRGDIPANCHLFKCNMQTNRLLLTQEKYEERLMVENSDIEKYTTIVDQKSSTENKDK